MADDDTSVSGPGNNAGTDTGAGFDPGASTGSADTSSIDPGSNTPVSDTPSTGPGGVASPPDGESLGGTWSQEGAPWVSTFPNGTQIVVNPDGSHTLRVAINGPGNASETAPEDTRPTENQGTSFIPWDGPLTQGGQEDDFNWLLDRPPLSLDMSKGYLKLCSDRRSQQVAGEMLDSIPEPDLSDPVGAKYYASLKDIYSPVQAPAAGQVQSAFQKATSMPATPLTDGSPSNGQPQTALTQETVAYLPQNSGDVNQPANQEKAQDPAVPQDATGLGKGEAPGQAGTDTEPTLPSDAEWRRQERDALKQKGLATQWPGQGKINADFYEQRTDKKSGQSRLHGALDIKNDKGADVYASDPGVVINVTPNPTTHETRVDILHDDGSKSVYMHTTPSVKVGDRVLAGDKVGITDMSGDSSGPHIHYEYWENGHRVDPMKHLPKR